VFSYNGDLEQKLKLAVVSAWFAKIQIRCAWGTCGMWLKSIILILLIQQLRSILWWYLQVEMNSQKMRPEGLPCFVRFFIKIFLCAFLHFCLQSPALYCCVLYFWLIHLISPTTTAAWYMKN